MSSRDIFLSLSRAKLGWAAVCGSHPLCHALSLSLYVSLSIEHDYGLNSNCIWYLQWFRRVVGRAVFLLNGRYYGTVDSTVDSTDLKLFGFHLEESVRLGFRYICCGITQSTYSTSYSIWWSFWNVYCTMCNHKYVFFFSFLFQKTLLSLATTIDRAWTMVCWGG